jgi:hypothetical protein
VSSDVKPLEDQSDGEKLIEKPGQDSYTAHVVEQQLEKLPSQNKLAEQDWIETRSDVRGAANEFT